MEIMVIISKIFFPKIIIDTPFDTDMKKTIKKIIKNNQILLQFGEMYIIILSSGENEIKMYRKGDDVSCSWVLTAI